jgi:hypothetical protein
MSASSFLLNSMWCKVNPLKWFSRLRTSDKYCIRTSSLAEQSFSICLVTILESVLTIQVVTHMALSFQSPRMIASYSDMLFAFVWFKHEAEMCGISVFNTWGWCNDCYSACPRMAPWVVTVDGPNCLCAFAGVGPKTLSSLLWNRPRPWILLLFLAQMWSCSRRARLLTWLFWLMFQDFWMSHPNLKDKAGCVSYVRQGRTSHIMTKCIEINVINIINVIIT